jgi:hypothetical protein
VRIGWLLNCALIGGALVWPGCVQSDSGAGGAALGSSLTPKKTWHAAGNLRDPAKAIDDDTGTAAVSTNSYANAFIDVDLGKVCLFNRIIVDHGPDEYGFPTRMAVYTSLDGQSFSPLTQVAGKRKVTNVLLISPVLARYVRLQVVSPGPRPWSVAEISFQ